MILAMGDEEWHADLLGLAVKRDLVGIFYESLLSVDAENPHYVVPMMWDRVCAIVGHPLALALSPDVVSAHDRAKGIGRIVGGDAGCMVASER
ncbi:hypothetical protein [Novosphingobium sp.]|uniref:hypothetical protein n=1 Tax=Novosphingobium sp. TaxID=1874826 RepID=UPI0035661160